MYIKKIRLEDIRCFEKCEIVFSNNITVLAGANNSGKSTILKSIYKLQENTAITQKDIRSTKISARILTELCLINDTDRETFRKDKQIVPQRENAFIIHDLYKNSEQNSIIADNEGSNKLNFDNLNTISSLDFPSSLFLGLPKTEDQNNFIYPFFSKRKSNNYYSQGGRENTFSVLDTLQNLPAKVQKVLSQSFAKEKFSQLCNEILGFEIGIIPGDNSEIRLGIYTSYNTTIPLESMGEGVGNIIGIIVTLLSENGKLFLIEEIENDLHPLVLKKILNLIIEKSANNQFIISTHSNIVLKYLGSLDSTKIIFTDSKIISGKDSYVPTASTIEISNLPTERIKVLELLGYDLFDFDIYSAFLILEESSAEKIIREFLIPNFFPNLQFRLRTIAAKGASDISPKFNDLHRLFLYLHKSEIYKDKAWVLIDGDSTGLEVTNKLKETYKSWDNSHFMNFEKSQFELYYPDHFKEQVDQISEIKNGASKQEAKAKLLNSVIEYINIDKAKAKKEFEVSAKEVIEKLNIISRKL